MAFIWICLVLWASIIFAGIMLWVAGWRVAQVAGIAAKYGQVPLCIRDYGSLTLGQRVWLIIGCHIFAALLAFWGYRLSEIYYGAGLNVFNFATLWSCSQGLIFSFPAFLLGSPR